MYFNAKIASAILLFASGALAAPVPQHAGEGAAANSILSSTDNGTLLKDLVTTMIFESLLLT